MNYLKEFKLWRNLTAKEDFIFPRDRGSISTLQNPDDERRTVTRSRRVIDGGGGAGAREKNEIVPG